MSVKVIVQVYPMLPAADEADRAARRPLGRDADAYQACVRDWVDLVQAAEDLGYWGFSTIEHHFHSEGYEIAPSPGAICGWLAGQTKRINLGHIGYVLGAHNAIRVAEESAVLDHILQGRWWTGLARGYQSRWTNVLGQHLGGVATLSDGSAEDMLNRRIFEEQVELMLAAWTQDSVEFDGEFTKVPYPTGGMAGYPAADTAALFGAPGEADEHELIHKISVTPPPYQKPHPPVFVATSSSPDSVSYCGRKGFVCANFTPIKKSEEFAQIYQDASVEAGYPIEFGQNQALVRWPHVTSTSQAYDEALRKYDVEIFERFYSKFFKAKMPVGADVLQSVKDSGLFLGGTPDEARAQFEKEWSIVPAEYAILIFHWAQQPTADVIREMELLATEVFPAIGGMAPPEERPLPPRV